MIYKVEYKVVGREDGLKVSTMDQIRFKKSDDPIDYSKVTQENIVSWVKSKLGTVRENKIYSFLDNEMKLKKLNQTSSGVPWS